MLSFKSILLAAAAFASFSMVTAIPTPETGSSLLQRAPQAGGLLGGGLPKLPIVGGGLPGGSSPATRRGEIPSCGPRIKKCHDDISEIIVKIKLEVGKGKDGADCGVIIGLLKLVIELLEGLLYDLKLIIKAEIVLGCTLEELAGIVGGLLILIIEVVWLVLSIVGWVDVALCGLIAEIGVLLCEILVVVFALVDGLLILVVELIKPYGEHCKYVKYEKILVILGITL